MPAELSGTVVVNGITISSKTLTTTSGYELISCGEARRSRRRDVAVSPYVHYEAEIASVHGAIFYDLEVRAVAADFGAAKTLKDALFSGLSAKSYTLAVSLDGTATDTYACRAASEMEARWLRHLVLNARIEMSFTIPVRKTGS